jgi:hypothetical protein
MLFISWRQFNTGVDSLAQKENGISQKRKGKERKEKERKEKKRKGKRERRFGFLLRTVRWARRYNL